MKQYKMVRLKTARQKVELQKPTKTQKTKPTKSDATEQTEQQPNKRLVDKIIVYFPLT